MDDKPWTFELDLFCLASTIYSILCGKYMTVDKQASGGYAIRGGVPVYLNQSAWRKIFDTLINIKSGHLMPNLQDLRHILKEIIESKEALVKEKMSQFNLVIGE